MRSSARWLSGVIPMRDGQSAPVIASSGLTHTPRNSRVIGGGWPSPCLAADAFVRDEAAATTETNAPVTRQAARAAFRVWRVISDAGLPGWRDRCQAVVHYGDEFDCAGRVCDGERVAAMLMSIGSLTPLCVR